MTGADKTRTILSVKATGPAKLAVSWSDGTHVELNFSGLLKDRAFKVLQDPAEFAQVTFGDWGHSLEWACGAEMGADALWLETLSAQGRNDARTFLEFRLRNGLSLSGTAEELGLSRRMVAYYSNGEKPVPRPILLACRGWEASHAA
jgi:hypothetical protein